MQRLFSKFRYLSFVTLLGICLVLTGCGNDTATPAETEPESNPASTAENTVQQAAAHIDSGDLRSAYDLLKDDSSAEAKALYEKFLFVPTYLRAGSAENIISYDENGCIAKVIESTPAGTGQTVYAYTSDEHGNPLTETVTDADGVVHLMEYAYVYNEQAHCLKKTMLKEDGTSVVWEYTYDEDGRCLTETVTYAPDNETLTEYTYDEDGRLIKEESATEFGSYVCEYAYNENGELITYTQDHDILFEYTYDKDNRTVQRTKYGEHKTLFVYDEDGNLIQKDGEDVCEWTLLYYENGIPAYMREWHEQVNDLQFWMLY